MIELIPDRSTLMSTFRRPCIDWITHLSMYRSASEHWASSCNVCWECPKCELSYHRWPTTCICRPDGTWYRAPSCHVHTVWTSTNPMWRPTPWSSCPLSPKPGTVLDALLSCYQRQLPRWWPPMPSRAPTRCTQRCVHVLAVRSSILWNWCTRHAPNDRCCTTPSVDRRVWCESCESIRDVRCMSSRSNRSTPPTFWSFYHVRRTVESRRLARRPPRTRCDRVRASSSRTRRSAGNPTTWWTSRSCMKLKMEETWS